MALTDARYYKTLLICPNRQFLLEIGPLLARALPLAPVRQLGSYPGRKQIAETLHTFDAKLCLLDFSGSVDECSRVLGDLRIAAPKLVIVVLLRGGDPSVALTCLREGATHFLVHPFSTDQMEVAVEKLTRLVPPPARVSSPGKVIAVIPAKGAAGATTIACNLAFQCKRMGTKSVLLADLDALSGTVSFALRLKPAYSFIDVLGREENLDADLWKQMVVGVQGIDVLLAPESPVDPASELPSAEPIISFARELYERVILDCGSPFGPWNLSAAQECDDIVLVVTNELASLQALQRTFAYYEQNGVDRAKTKVLVNRYTQAAGLNRDRLSAVCGTDPIDVIPDDADSVQKSVFEGKPVPATSSVGTKVGAVAAQLFFSGRESQSAARKGGFLSLFGL